MTSLAYGPYSLDAFPAIVGRKWLANSQLVISRQDSDHKRTVAIIDSYAEWERFIEALEEGLDEVTAVKQAAGHDQ